MSEVRINSVNIIAGKRRGGKTDLVKNLIYPLQKKRIVIDTFDTPNWRNYKTFNHPERESELIPIVSSYQQINLDESDTIRIVNADVDRSFQWIEKEAWNCLAVVEDATRFFDEGRIPKDVKTFVLNTKQRNVDLIFIFHSLGDVPPRLVKWSDHLTLFRTVENFNSNLRSKFPNQQIEMAFNKVRTMEPFKHITIAIGG